MHYTCGDRDITGDLAVGWFPDRGCELVPVQATFTFASASEAAEAYSCSKVLARLHRQCWENHVIAWSPVMDEFKIDTEQNIQSSAAFALSKAFSNNLYYNWLS